ncbi:hypothetical protein BC941DRAFT_442442 [Chlamydoabsidia padenii]|nr:hypothetical protein BC941DRAFT_442442 [Chlamydoabsidia padenii]
MSSTHLDEKFDGTFRQLFDAIERCTEHSSTDRLQTLLEELGNQLALGLEAFSEPSTSARSKIIPDKPISLGSTHTFIITADEKDVICHLSDVLTLNEQQCAILWNAQKKHNSVILSDFMTQKQRQKQDPIHQVQGYSQVFQFFTQAYFEDRLSILQSISSLLRLSQQYDDKQPAHVSIATDTINNLMGCNGSTTIDEQLIRQFNKLVRTLVPATFAFSPHLIQVYTHQILKEEKAILEILIIYYIARPCPASRLLCLYQEFEANGFGTEQSFGHHLNAVGQTMCTEVSYLCGLLSAQLLQQATVTQDSSIVGGGDDNGLEASPEVIISLNHVMSFLGDMQVHTLPLLAWASFLSSLEPLVYDGDDTFFGKIKNMLDGTLQSDTSWLLSSKDRPKSIHHGRASAFMATSHRTPIIEQGPELIQRYIGRAIKLNAPEYIYTILSSSHICKNEDVNKLAYHVIIYELLYRFSCMVNLSYLVEDKHSIVIQDFCLLFQNEPELCDQFWKTSGKESALMDMDDDSSSTVNLSTLLLDTKSGGFPRKFNDLIQLLISVCGDSILTTDTTLVQNVYNYLMPDGWHALVDKLIKFVQGDRDTTGVPDACAILQLLEKVLLSSDRAMINNLMDHVELINPSTDTAASPFMLTLLCNIVTSSSTVRDCMVDILTLGIRCLTILLPYYSANLWTFIGTSSLFPRPLESDPFLSLEFKKVPTRSLGKHPPAQIDHIIASVECEIGNYSILLALLDLIGGLIEDIKQHWWSSRNEQDKNEHYKAEILSGYLHYLTSHILPYYSGWRYKSLYERYLIGSKMTAMFNNVDRFFKFDNNGSGSDNDNDNDAILYDGKGKVAPTMVNVRAVMHYWFLKDEYAIRFYISPLLDVMSNGAWMAEGLYSSNRIKEAQQAETLTRLTFLFVKSLLQQQLVNNNSNNNDNASTGAGLLEKAMMNHRSGNSNKTDFLFRLAQLIRYNKHPSMDYIEDNTLSTIPILATNVISLLCLSVSRWKVVPNFVQYLGDTDQVQSIIRSYLAIAKDPSHSEPLLTSIWQMMSLLVETQPSLALLFMECGDAIMPSPKSAVKLLDQQNSNLKKPTASVTFSLPSDSGDGSTSNESAVRAAVELLNDWQSLSIAKPTVLSNVLRFLTTFWQSAFDHYAMVQRTRSDTALWQALEAILLNPSNMDSISGENSEFECQQQQRKQQFLDDLDLDDEVVENILDMVDNVISDTNQSVRRKCCMDLNRALIMRLISFEIQLTAGSQMAQGIKLTTGTAVVGDKLPAGLKNILFKMGEQKKLEWMRQCFIKDDFDPSLTVQVQEEAQRVLACDPDSSLRLHDINSLLQMVPNVGFGDDTNDTTGQTRQYGASYLYDLRLAVSRTSSLYRKATQTEREHLGHQRYDNYTTEIMVTPELRTVRMIKQTCVQFISSVCSYNYNWSMVDAQMVLLQSFNTLMETSSGHAPEVIWHTKTKSTLYSFINELVDQVVEDFEGTANIQQQQQQQQQKQNGIAVTRHQYIVSLIRALTEDWISANRALIMDKSTLQQQVKWDYIQEAISLVKKFCQLLQRGVTPEAHQRPLLESILLCIRTMHNSYKSCGVSQQGNNDGLQDDLTQLVHVVCKSFSSTVECAMQQQNRQKAPVMTLLPDDKSEECIKDVTVLLALLGELVKSNEQQKSLIPVDVWLPVFEEHSTIATLLKIAYHGMILIADELESQTKLDSSGLHNIMVSPYAESAMYFMVALSNIPQAAMTLRHAGVMDLLCNNALSKQLERGTLDIFVRFGGKPTTDNRMVVTSDSFKTTTTTATHTSATGVLDDSSRQNEGDSKVQVNACGSGFVERHPLHVLWCQMLNVLSNLVRIVGASDDGLLRLGVLFIQKYSKQVDRSFAIANGGNDSLLGLAPSESLSSPLLTEIELLTTILFCLAKQSTRVSTFAVNVFMAFKNCGLPLVKRYLYHLTHPNHMQSQLFPADQDEKQQSQIYINNNNNDSVEHQHQHQQQVSMSYTSEQDVSQLMYSTTQRVVRIARNILGSIVLLTEAETILIGKDNTWPFGNTILSPDTRTCSSFTVSFGTMKEWTMACLQLTVKTSLWINEYQKQKKDTSSTTTATTLQQPNMTDLQALLSTLEFSIILLTTQTILWIAKPDIHQDERKIIANDNLKSLVNLLDKIYTSLKKLELDMQQSIKSKSIKDELQKLECHIIDPLKHLLITRFFESTQ